MELEMKIGSFVQQRNLFEVATFVCVFSKEGYFFFFLFLVFFDIPNDREDLFSFFLKGERYIPMKRAPACFVYSRSLIKGERIQNIHGSIAMESRNVLIDDTREELSPSLLCIGAHGRNTERRSQIRSSNVWPDDGYSERER
ncbi:hypothetical protein CDAR_165291 [Caerostris darwini]|uniref:Uncharacterized protein n=1 Tax=Caerostris darwini TaxID=1538125 RepID=A0AAV4NVJ0_9ARAC|nr:hypothetical protein CDAR_165291 [Caerostris darwini]